MSTRMPTGWRVVAVLATTVLATIGWALHWHVTQVNQTIRQTAAPSIVVHGKASADGITLKQCKSLKPGESEAVIKATFGPFGPVVNDSAIYAIGVAYNYDYGWYALSDGSRGRYCTLYFDKNRNLGDVAVDLWDTLP